MNKLGLAPDSACRNKELDLEFQRKEWDRRPPKKVLLVWPKFESHSFWNFEEVCRIVGVSYMTPPLGLLTIAGMLPASWDLRLVDENVDLLTDHDLEQAEIVIVSCKIVHRARALEVIALAKRWGKTVIVGGPDPTMSPQHYVSSGADALCFGEGEAIMPEVLFDLREGSLKEEYRASRLPNLKEETPAPRFDLIDHRKYLYIGLQYSRGCPYHCEFCNVIDLFDNEYRTKTVEQVLAELTALYQTGYRGQVDFFDDNMVGNLKQVKPLLQGIADWLRAHKYPFHMSTSVTLNVVKDREVLRLLREARFKAFLVGIETPDEEALKRAKKPHNTGFSLPEATDMIYREVGATLHSGFLLGLDGEPADIGLQMVRCIDEAAIPWVMAGVVYPLPGTQLAKRLDREHRLFPQARTGIPEGSRDQVSAGIQFVPERGPQAVLDDLVEVMHHSFEAKKYFERCTSVAVRLNTIPNLMPGVGIFFRNVRTFFRLCGRMLRRVPARGPFWKGLFRVLLRNRDGLEAYVTLSVLYLHFQSMLPYVYGELERQRVELRTTGEAEWISRQLCEPAEASQVHAS